MELNPKFLYRFLAWVLRRPNFKKKPVKTFLLADGFEICHNCSAIASASLFRMHRNVEKVGLIQNHPKANVPASFPASRNTTNRACLLSISSRNMSLDHGLAKEALSMAKTSSRSDGCIRGLKRQILLHVSIHSACLKQCFLEWHSGQRKTQAELGVIPQFRVATDCHCEQSEAISCPTQAEIAGGTVPHGTRDCRSSSIDRLEACPADHSSQ